MAAGGSSTFVEVGPGRLYVAPIGTAEPADNDTALPSVWRAVGYTEDGSRFTSELTSEDIEVAEELDAIRTINTKRTNTLALSMAEASRRNLALALNQGANAANDDTALEPPDLGTEVRVMLVWDSDETPSATNVRWLYRQCYQTGAVEINRAKAPNKTLLPVTFAVEKPSGLAPFKVFPSSTGLI